MALEKYREKRDFSITEEPSGGKKKAESIFVVQEHHARNLHWDFRLEIGGVLVSWAIPKEPNDKDRRLAVMTEDHPIEYAGFSGSIPEGQYGAGTVKIWDSGKFENIKEKGLASCLKDGQLEVRLKGKKLKGNYALIKLKPTEKYPGKNNWLFFKMKEQT